MSDKRNNVIPIRRSSVDLRTILRSNRNIETTAGFEAEGGPLVCGESISYANS